MRTLSKNQITTLKLLRESKTPSEICKITKMPASSVDEAIRRGKDNIYRAIEILRLAVENGLVDKNQILELKRILSKI